MEEQAPGLSARDVDSYWPKDFRLPGRPSTPYEPTLKTGLFERLATRTLPTDALRPSPHDEFVSLGPSESALARHVRHARENGSISGRIIVRKTAKGFEIVNGHHRWAAAKKVGLTRVPVRWVND